MDIVLCMRISSEYTYKNMIIYDNICICICKRLAKVCRRCMFRLDRKQWYPEQPTRKQTQNPKLKTHSIPIKSHANVPFSQRRLNRPGPTGEGGGGVGFLLDVPTMHFDQLQVN